MLINTPVLSKPIYFEEIKVRWPFLTAGQRGRELKKLRKSGKAFTFSDAIGTTFRDFLVFLRVG
jgi:hypothetical protein